MRDCSLNWTIFLLFLLIYDCQSEITSSEDESQKISAALSDSAVELFTRHKIDFDVILIGKATSHLRDVLNVFRVESRVKMIASRDLNCEMILNRVFVMLMEKIEVFKKVLDLKCFEKFDLINPAAMVLKYLIYVEEGFDSNELNAKKPDYLFGDLLHFAYFIVDDGTEIQLKTFEWWTADACGITRFITVNSLMKSSNQWKQNPLQIPQKFKNFHNCTLKVYSAIVDLNVIKSQERMGITLTLRNFVIYHIRNEADQAIAKIIGAMGNYRINHMKVYESFTKGFDVQHIVEKFMPFEKYHIGSSFLDDTLIVIIPVPNFYSSYEKMILPFDFQTWTYLFGIFGIGLVIIFITNLTPRWFQDLIYGKNVRGAGFNLIGTFFGIGQRKLPENSTGRILLLFFIYFCLIFRTAYQGVFFEMMTTNITKPQPTTIMELKERNFTIYTLDDIGKNRHTYIASKIPQEARPELQRLKIWDMMLRYLYLFDPKETLAMAFDKTDYKTLLNLFVIKPDLLKETIFTESQGIRTYKNNFMYHHIEDVMQWLITGGIPQFHFRFVVETALYRIEPPDPGPQVFAMKDLHFGFIVWIISCGTAVAVFLMEISWRVLRNMIRYGVRRSNHLIGIFGFLRVLEIVVNIRRAD